MTAPDDVAVVIVNHNTALHLLHCLESLHAGGLAGVSATTWVVDNASTDDSAGLVRRRFPHVRVIESPENVGYAAANNMALRAAGFDRRPPSAPPSARHALLLNPDTIVPQHSLAQLVGCLEAEPDVAVVGPKLVLPDGTLDLACRRSFPTPEVSAYRFTGLSRLFPGSRRFGRYNLTFLDPDEPADVDSVVGACMLVRGTAIARVGLLDERFWMYGEDLDWALRFHEDGWRVVYRPQVVVRHVKRAASEQSPRARFEFQRAMWLFYRKHYATSTPRPIGWLITGALAMRGGAPLVREMISAWRSQ